MQRLFIKNPYPFRQSELIALEKALAAVYPQLGAEVHQEWIYRENTKEHHLVHVVILKRRTSMKTLRELVNLFQVMYRALALVDPSTYERTAFSLETVICQDEQERPAWAIPDPE